MLNKYIVALFSFSVHHLDHGMTAVERVAPAAEGLAAQLHSQPEIDGAFVLATCNRLEIYVDSAHDTIGRVEAVVRHQLRTRLSHDFFLNIPLRARAHHGTMSHLFRVASGLDSMVVGEREIAGQMRRSLKKARIDGTISPLLSTAIEHALRTSRRIFSSTALSSQGRSVVSSGLDLGLAALRRCPTQTTVLLVGTGAYAGAAVHALRLRGLNTISVFSRSGRAAAFASSHHLAVAESLPDALARADLVLTCSGTGEYLITPEMISDPAHPTVMIDLALRRDIDPAVGVIPGVTLICLDDIQESVSSLSTNQIEAAQSLVNQGLAELLGTLRGRQMDPAVIALRDLVSTLVEDEITRLPHGNIPVDEAAHALRRLAARLMHVPMVRARKAAEEGRRDDYLNALGELYDIDVDVEKQLSDRDLLDPGTLDCGTCPATGFVLGDLSACEPAPRDSELTSSDEQDPQEN